MEFEARPHRRANGGTGTTLKHTRLDNSYEAEQRKLVAVDLLILDDFAIDVLDSVESRDLYDLFLERYRTGSVIVTTNRGPDEWLATFADFVRAQSAIDRFTSNAYDLVIEGDRPGSRSAALRSRSRASSAWRTRSSRRRATGCRRRARRRSRATSSCGGERRGRPPSLCEPRRDE